MVVTMLFMGFAVYIKIILTDENMQAIPEIQDKLGLKVEGSRPVLQLLQEVGAKSTSSVHESMYLCVWTDAHA